MDAFTVVVATHGDASWAFLGDSRAAPSALEQGVEVVRYHGGDSVAEARNAGLERVETEFVIFLDADDELEPGYIEEMAKGTADFRCPSIRQVYSYGPTPPRVPRVWNHEHRCSAECLLSGNWLVIGTAARTEIVREVGGFRPKWPVYEDYDLWQRCYLRGATFETMPEAVYRAHVGKNSRNRSMSTKRRNRIHEQIDKANGVVRPEGVY